MDRRREADSLGKGRNSIEQRIIANTRIPIYSSSHSFAADQSSQIFRGNNAALKLIAVRSGPVGFKADPSFVAVAGQRCNLPFPVDGTFAERRPDRLAA